MRSIKHCFDIAEPQFKRFLNIIEFSEFQYMLYDGIELKNSRIYFKFKSTNLGLSFKVFAGFDVNGMPNILRGRTHEIINHFERLKWETQKD